jgi:Xaa-Pro aminopeptidase
MRVIGRKKLEEIREKIAEKGLDAALFVNDEPVIDSNIAYISGFSGMLKGFLIVSHDVTRLITMDLDYERAQEQAHVDDLFKCKHSLHLYQSLRSHCKGYRKVGVVKKKFTLEMAEKTGIRPSGCVDISSLMERARMVKEPKEIEIIRKSAGICNKGVKFLGGFLREGVRESEVAAELERNLKMMGSERPPFETIVSSGKRGMFVHPNPPASENTIRPGLGLVDFGATYRGYATDVTVPFVSGRTSERQDHMIQTIVSLWEDVRKKLRAGVKTKTLHEIYEKAVESSGFKVKHSLGHSLGLDVHEYPSVSGADVRLKKGMVLAIEPGVYDRKLGGCRLENTVMINGGGCEVLTKSKLIRM